MASRMASVPIAVAALLVLAATALGAPALPLSGQAPADIVYLGEGGSVWLTDETGDKRSQIAGAEGFSAIVWAPDGQRLALVEGGPSWGTARSVYIARPDGSELTKVGDGYAPVWSSDSKQVSYVSNFTPAEEGSEQELRIFDLQDGGDRVVTRRRWVSGLWPIESISRSPGNGMTAVYVAGLEMEGHLVVVDSEGKTVWEITDLIYSAESFAWSPDGQYIVYRDSGDPFMGGEDPSLKIVEVETQEVLAELPEAGFWPRWSPDGEKIAAFLWLEEGGFQVIILDAHSQRLLYRSDHIFADIWNSRPSWSPDASRLLFSSFENGEWDVVVMDEDGTLRTIARGQYPEAIWSPDGARVAVAVGQQEGREIYVVKPDGSDLRKVADGGMPRWRPLTASERSNGPVCGVPFLGSSALFSLALAGLWASRRGRGTLR